MWANQPYSIVRKRSDGGGEGGAWKPNETSGEKTYCSWRKQTHSNPLLFLSRGPWILLCRQPRKEKKRLDTPLVLAECPGRCLFRDSSRSRTKVHILRPFGCLQVQVPARFQQYSQQKHLKQFSKATDTCKDKFVTSKSLDKSELRNKGRGLNTVREFHLYTH